jgi:hypothetical protein
MAWTTGVWFPEGFHSLRHRIQIGSRDHQASYAMNILVSLFPDVKRPERETDHPLSSSKVKVKVKLSLCLTKHHAMKTYWGSGGIAPRILDLGTRWRWVVSFTPQPLYPRGKSPWYPLDRRLGGPQSRSGRGGEEKNSHSRRESNPRTPIVQPVAQRYTDWAEVKNAWSCTFIPPYVFMAWYLVQKVKVKVKLSLCFIFN